MSSTSTISLVHMQDVYPHINSCITLYMLESFGTMVKLKSQYLAQEIRVQIWTNALNKFNVRICQLDRKPHKNLQESLERLFPRSN